MKVLSQHGVSLDPDDIIHDKDSRNVYLDAPEGHYFKESGYHTSSAQGYGMSELWDSVIDEVSPGLGKCSEGGCDSCGYQHSALGNQFNK